MYVISYAKLLQMSAESSSLLECYAECSFNLCKGSANEREIKIKQVLILFLRVPPILFKGSASRTQNKINLFIFFV